MKRRPDTAASAIAVLREESDLEVPARPRCQADPCVAGVWMVSTDAWVAIVYLAGYAEPTGRIRQHDDFEVSENDIAASLARENMERRRHG